MAPKIPEFILRNMFVRDSVSLKEDGFSFALRDSYAPATVQAFALAVMDETIPPADVFLQLPESEPVNAASISAESPFALPVDTLLTVTVEGHDFAEGHLRISVDTREVGLLSFSIKTAPAEKGPSTYPQGHVLKRLFRGSLKGEIVVNLDEVIGEIDPHIYGHFVEHLENCVYGGVFSPGGARMDPDVLQLVRAIQPTNIRYPGGNFASDYHWEEGIGPKENRPVHVDRAWHVEDPNLVGTDEFLAFCQAVDADPFLVINDGSGTPEEAARWVSYCNDAPETALGKQRAANGHPEPYRVPLWGLGNEVWGEWQIGHTDAEGYVKRIKAYIEAMRAVDPNVKLVAVGLDHLEDDPREAESWNRTVLEGIGDAIDYLSFHVYQPSEEGYCEHYDPETFYHDVVAAPHSTEEAIKRMAATIRQVVPDRQIGIALDEYNVKFPPAEGARSMHDLTYTLRDGLYVAGMLNAFHRQCADLKIANIAMLVNVLPLIVNPPDQPAFPTSLYYPFLLYRLMEKQALSVAHWCPVFETDGLGLNINQMDQVPYIDLTATRSEDRQRVVLAVVNRHPLKKAQLMLYLKGDEHRQYMAREAWQMTGPAPLAANTVESPEVVGVESVTPPSLRFGWADLKLPPASLMVLVLEKKKD